MRLGEVVRQFERPVPYAVSPDVFTGVDCRLATLAGGRPRGIGTTVGRASISGGQVLQASALAQVVPSEFRRRLPWAHYLARPGQVETVGKAAEDAMATGFLAASAGTGLDLGGIADRLMGDVQASALLDRRPPFRIARTRLRWTLERPDDGGRERAAFTIQEGQLRTLRLRSSSLTVAQAADFAEDVARHDWLLTALTTMLDTSRLDLGMDERVVAKLRPAFDHLLHLWMPGARLDDQVQGFWLSVERASGFSRQWETQVSRVRDQLALHTITLLRAVAVKDAGSPE